ncbi:MAG TPA: hypothetical protein VFU19_04725 [Iamia sp.]|nr:hypothetical protein [Iamia sp.]
MGFVAVVVLRWVMSLDGRYPRVVADEPAYLAMARLLAGGTRWDMGFASTYGPGYSVLLAPWFALDLSPNAVYRAAIVTNVALGGLTFLAFEAVARRLLGVRPPLSVGLAAVAASLPALVATTGLAWSDALAPLAFALLLLALARVVERPGAPAIALLVAATAGGYAVHARVLPLAPLVAAVLVVLAVGRRLPARLAAAGVVGLGLAIGLVQVGSEAIYTRLYDPQQVTPAFNEADRITRLWPLALSATGQLWTIVVTTGGLAGLGLVALATAAVRGWRAARPDEDDGPIRRAAVRLATPGADGATPALVPLAVLALVAMAFLVSTVFMTDRPRADHLVYGRYNDLFTGPLVLAGGAALLASARRRRTALTALAVGVVTVAAAAALWRFRRATLEGGYLVYPVLGVVAIDPEGPPALRSITVVGVVVLAALAALALGLPRRAAPVAVVVLAAALCVAGGQRAVDRITPPVTAEPDDAAVIADVLPDGARLAWVAGDPVDPIAATFFRAQLYTPDNRSVRVTGAPWEGGEPYVVAGALKPEPFAAGYRLAWVDASSSLGLWVAPGARQDELAAGGHLLDEDGFGADPQADEGSVRFTEGPTIAGGRVRATVEVTRPTGAPWPTVAPGGKAVGRIRLGVAVDGARCGCRLLDARADLIRWVDGDVARLTVAVDVPFAAPDDEELALRVRLLREGVGAFGEPATAAFG